MSPGPMQFILAPLALMLICLIMSTKEQRAEARVRMKPLTRAAWVVTAIGWAIMLWPW